MAAAPPKGGPSAKPGAKPGPKGKSKAPFYALAAVAVVGLGLVSYVVFLAPKAQQQTAVIDSAAVRAARDSAARANAKGTLALSGNIPSNARITVDSQTVARRDSLAPGRHILRIEASGYRPYEKPVEIAPNGVVELLIQLQSTTNQPDPPPVAPAAEILGGEEGQGPDQPQFPGHAPRPIHPAAGADRLGGVLDQYQTMTARDRQQRLHRGHLPEQVDRHDGPGPRRDGCLHRRRVEIETDGIDVHEHRGPAGIMDGARGGEEGERRGDHLVRRGQPQGPEREQQRIGPAGAANAMSRPAQLRHCRLQPIHLFTQNELLPVDHPRQSREHLVSDGLVLGNEIEKRDVHTAGRVEVTGEPSAVTGVGQSA